MCPFRIPFRKEVLTPVVIGSSTSALLASFLIRIVHKKNNAILVGTIIMVSYLYVDVYDKQKKNVCLNLCLENQNVS